MNHLNASNDISTILVAMTAGKEALDRVPVLENELKNLSDNFSHVNDALCIANNHSADLHEQLEATRKALAEREAELEAATFREADTRTKLETFRSMVSGALGTVTDATIVLQSEIEAVTEIVTRPAPEPEPASSGAAEGVDFASPMVDDPAPADHPEQYGAPVDPSEAPNSGSEPYPDPRRPDQWSDEIRTPIGGNIWDRRPDYAF